MDRQQNKIRSDRLQFDVEALQRIVDSQSDALKPRTIADGQVQTQDIEESLLDTAKRADLIEDLEDEIRRLKGELFAEQTALTRDRALIRDSSVRAVRLEEELRQCKSDLDIERSKVKLLEEDAKRATESAKDGIRMALTPGSPRGRTSSQRDASLISSPDLRRPPRYGLTIDSPARRRVFPTELKNVPPVESKALVQSSHESDEDVDKKLLVSPVSVGSGEDVLQRIAERRRDDARLLSDSRRPVAQSEAGEGAGHENKVRMFLFGADVNAVA
jgi:hypothetical protein